MSTDILLLPIFSKYSSCFLLEPCTTETIMTTEATPMMMPSIVSAVRALLAPMERTAIFNACPSFMPQSS